MRGSSKARIIEAWDGIAKLAWLWVSFGKKVDATFRRVRKRQYAASTFGEPFRPK
jgi:hypothetical protein